MPRDGIYLNNAQHGKGSRMQCIVEFLQGKFGRLIIIVTGSDVQ